MTGYVGSRKPAALALAGLLTVKYGRTERLLAPCKFESLDIAIYTEQHGYKHNWYILYICLQNVHRLYIYYVNQNKSTGTPPESYSKHAAINKCHCCPVRSQDIYISFLSHNYIFIVTQIPRIATHRFY